ncbi:MAG: MYXO-CTERM sorting domain-containing protein [Polyangiaceae bacterium]
MRAGGWGGSSSATGGKKGNAGGGDEGGCGCRVPTNREGSGAAWLAVLAGMVLARRRRTLRAARCSASRGS